MKNEFKLISMMNKGEILTGVDGGLRREVKSLKASADNMAELLQSILDGTVHIDKINRALRDYHGN